jgi:hypothetical protein
VLRISRKVKRGTEVNEDLAALCEAPSCVPVVGAHSAGSTAIADAAEWGRAHESFEGALPRNASAHESARLRGRERAYAGSSAVRHGAGAISLRKRGS